jgi:hypothetical protein
VCAVNGEWFAEKPPSLTAQEPHRESSTFEKNEKAAQDQFE